MANNMQNQGDSKKYQATSQPSQGGKSGATSQPQQANQATGQNRQPGSSVNAEPMQQQGGKSSTDYGSKNDQR